MVQQTESKLQTMGSRRLRLCHISDTHGHHRDLNIPKCDVLVHSGDFSMIGGKKEVEDFFEWVVSLSQCKYKCIVAGNHDLSFDPLRGGNMGTKPEWLSDLLFEFTAKLDNGNYYLENNSCEIEGVKFWGSPTSSWFHGDRWAFNVREPEAHKLYSTIPLGVDVLITHGPAYTYGDWCVNCACYVGDHALEYHVKRVKPLIHLFGHIHESYGYQKTSFGTTFFNGCNCNLRYSIENKPWLIDADFDNKEVEVLNERV